jgi:hypothetical protein
MLIDTKEEEINQVLQEEIAWLLVKLFFNF